MKVLTRCLCALSLLALGCAASAQGFSITIAVDENGNGRLTNTAGFSAPLPFALAPDPGPGGLPAALTYDLLNPPGLVAGDLLLLEPGTRTTLSDIIRFNAASFTGGAGSLVFYSDNADGADALADTGFPTAQYANNVTAFELGPEGDNGFTYTPVAGQPGFVAGAGGPVTYLIRSDVSAVPEPGSLALLLCGGAASALFVVRRRRAVGRRA